jgi:hypothetical protein
VNSLAEAQVTVRRLTGTSTRANEAEDPSPAGWAHLEPAVEDVP